MKPVRGRLASLACLLLLLVLFNGMACAVSHGQMLQPMFEPSTPSVPQAMDGMANRNDMQGMECPHAQPMKHSLLMPGMESPFADCFFAGSMPLCVVVFALISWLLRHREARPPKANIFFSPQPRFRLPRLNPRAP